jgi:hypothetical protein
MESKVIRYYSEHTYPAVALCPNGTGDLRSPYRDHLDLLAVGLGCAFRSCGIRHLTTSVLVSSRFEHHGKVTLKRTQQELDLLRVIVVDRPIIGLSSCGNISGL